MNFKIEIQEGITDQQIMEHCLNLKCSGYDPTLIIAFYGLGKKWLVDDLMFIMKELEESK